MLVIGRVRQHAGMLHVHDRAVGDGWCGCGPAPPPEATPTFFLSALPCFAPLALSSIGQFGDEDRKYERYSRFTVLYVSPTPAMSVTTTANSTRTILRVLDDYEIHHAASDPGSTAPLNARPDLSAAALQRNPEHWPTQHRAVPPYKPINRNLDMATRPGGANVVERIFIATLLNGCRINAVSISLPSWLPT